MCILHVGVLVIVPPVAVIKGGVPGPDSPVAGLIKVAAPAPPSP